MTKESTEGGNMCDKRTKGLVRKLLCLAALALTFPAPYQGQEWEIPKELLSSKTIHIEMSKPKNRTTWKKQQAVLKKLQKKISKMKLGWQITPDAESADLLLKFKHWMPEAVVVKETSYESEPYCSYIETPGAGTWYTIVEILSPQTREVLWEGGDCCPPSEEGLFVTCSSPGRGIGNALKALAKSVKRYRKRNP